MQEWYAVRPPNGLALSCAAPLDREDGRADSSYHNGDDLRAAQRRQIQRRVGRQRRFRVIGSDNLQQQVVLCSWLALVCLAMLRSVRRTSRSRQSPVRDRSRSSTQPHSAA
jgi:hypothetical protein